MTGISNICHLRHDLQQCDCAIKSFRQQTLGEMTCYFGTEVILTCYQHTIKYYQVKLIIRMWDMSIHTCMASDDRRFLAEFLSLYFAL